MIVPYRIRHNSMTNTSEDLIAFERERQIIARSISDVKYLIDRSDGGFPQLQRRQLYSLISCWSVWPDWPPDNLL
jgi:hypothetical protein